MLNWVYAWRTKEPRINKLAAAVVLSERTISADKIGELMYIGRSQQLNQLQKTSTNNLYNNTDNHPARY